MTTRCLLFFLFSVHPKSKAPKTTVKKKTNTFSNLEKSAELYSSSTEEMAKAIKVMASAISNLANALTTIAKVAEKYLEKEKVEVDQ